MIGTVRVALLVLHISHHGKGEEVCPGGLCDALTDDGNASEISTVLLQRPRAGVDASLTEEGSATSGCRSLAEQYVTVTGVDGRGRGVVYVPLEKIARYDPPTISNLKYHIGNVMQNGRNSHILEYWSFERDTNGYGPCVGGSCSFHDNTIIYHGQNFLVSMPDLSLAEVASEIYANKSSYESWENHNPGCCSKCSTACSPWSGSCKGGVTKGYYHDCECSGYVTVTGVNGRGKGVAYVPLNKLDHNTLHDLKHHISIDMQHGVDAVLLPYWSFYAVNGYSKLDDDMTIYPGQTFVVSMPDL